MNELNYELLINEIHLIEIIVLIHWNCSGQSADTYFHRHLLTYVCCNSLIILFATKYIVMNEKNSENMYDWLFFSEVWSFSVF